MRDFRDLMPLRDDVISNITQTGAFARDLNIFLRQARKMSRGDFAEEETHVGGRNSPGEKFQGGVSCIFRNAALNRRNKFSFNRIP